MGSALRLALTLALLGLTGCAEESRGDRPADCLDVAESVAETIAEGGRVRIGAEPLTINPRAASARDVRGTLVVAVYMTGPGGVEGVGLWTVDAIEGDPGRVRSIDTVARELTYWPRADLSVADPGVEITRGCV